MASAPLPLLTFTGHRNVDEPRAFWHKFFQTCVQLRLDAKSKCEYFASTLELDSPAYTWFHTLPTATQNDYDQLKAAYETKYRTTQKPDAMPDDDALEYLEKTFPVAATGLLEYDNKPNEPARRRYRSWGRDIAAAAHKQRIDSRVVSMLKKRVPKVLQEVIGKASSWDEFADAIEAADEERMKTRLEETARIERVEKQMEAMMKNQGPSARERELEALIRKMSQISVTPQSVPPRVAANTQTQYAPPSQQQPPTTRTQSGPTQTTNGGVGRAGTTPADWPARLAALKLNARNPHPDTPDGKAAYYNDVKRWAERYGVGTRADEHKPYPLTPGTRPIGSGECWYCGRDWHGGNQSACIATPVPIAEKEWRRLADSILKNTGTDTTAVGRALRQAAKDTTNVNFVDDTFEWQPGSSPTFSEQYGDASEWNSYTSSSTHANAESGEGKV
ncbi:hypothetical protein OH76DRAFT_1485752 [Lentinus brumalis]|uniref:Retrotransposon gag domain-containing protein n=1 Tax=Lentinus brumalis TaxID=2498619 RepID=A0A371D0W5_9APHY|nr:hypothetical protein OH76DRAFT_1485752 [Polyporus brumalis]